VQHEHRELVHLVLHLELEQRHRPTRLGARREVDEVRHALRGTREPGEHRGRGEERARIVRVGRVGRAHHLVVEEEPQLEPVVGLAHEERLGRPRLAGGRAGALAVDEERRDRRGAHSVDDLELVLEEGEGHDVTA
jgi:hypothetical protein